MKYLGDGQEVEVVQRLNDGKFLVVDIYLRHSGDGEEEYLDHSKPHVVDEVFDSSPTLKYSKHVDSLITEIENLQTKRSEITRGMRDDSREHEERQKALKKYAGVELLFDFIDGKISHYVVLDYRGPEIVEFATEMKTDSSCDREKLKLLSLFGGSNGDLTWNLNRYSDGSGCTSTVIPCTSLKMATEEAALAVSERIAKTLKRPEQYMITAAKKYGVDVPEEYRKAVNNSMISVAKKNLESAKESLLKCEKTLSDKQIQAKA